MAIYKVVDSIYDFLKTQASVSTHKILSAEEPVMEKLT